MARKVTIVKLPPGAPAPAGFTQGRTTRQGVTYFKVEQVTAAPVAPLPAAFDLSAMAMALDEVAAPVAVEVQDDQVDALLAKLGAMGLGGRRRARKGTKKAGKRATKKAGRKTRRA
jgi:hypothetical protein